MVKTVANGSCCCSCNCCYNSSTTSTICSYSFHNWFSTAEPNRTACSLHNACNSIAWKIRMIFDRVQCVRSSSTMNNSERKSLNSCIRYIDKFLFAWNGMPSQMKSTIREYGVRKWGEKTLKRKTRKKQIQISYSSSGEQIQSAIDKIQHFIIHFNWAIGAFFLSLSSLTFSTNGWKKFH